MKVNATHHDIAKAGFGSNKSTLQIMQELMKGKKGLTKSQASSACHTARKQLGIYKKGSAKTPSSDIDKQASMKTEIDQD